MNSRSTLVKAVEAGHHTNGRYIPSRAKIAPRIQPPPTLAGLVLIASPSWRGFKSRLNWKSSGFWRRPWRAKASQTLRKNWHFQSPDWCQSAEDTSTSSSPNSLRNPDAGIAAPGLNSRACADVSRCARQPSIWSRSSRCCAPDAACHAHRLWWACLQGDAAELRPLFPLSTLTHFGIAARILATPLAGNQEPLTQRAWRSGLPFLG